MSKEKVMGSEIENPYAPPKTERLESDRLLDQPDQAWRDRKLLVVRKKGAVLPDRCLKCNAPAEGYRFTRDVSWIRPMVQECCFQPRSMSVSYGFPRFRQSTSRDFVIGPDERIQQASGLAWKFGADPLRP